jgi:hypothetical protein
MSPAALFTASVQQAAGRKATVASGALCARPHPLKLNGPGKKAATPFSDRNDDIGILPTSSFPIQVTTSELSRSHRFRSNDDIGIVPTSSFPIHSRRVFRPVESPWRLRAKTLRIARWTESVAARISAAGLEGKFAGTRCAQASQLPSPARAPSQALSSVTAARRTCRLPAALSSRAPIGPITERRHRAVIF